MTWNLFYDPLPAEATVRQQPQQQQLIVIALWREIGIVNSDIDALNLPPVQKISLQNAELL